MQIGLFDGDKPFKIDKPVRLIEMFAGIGSQAKALERLNINFEHYRVCEFDKYAIMSYNAIHGTNFQTSDIRELTAKDLGITDTNKYLYIMTYSFPCTDLSKAGKQKGMSKGSGTRSGLLWEVERLLDECNALPQMLLMENVPDVIGTKNMPDFAEWIAKLEKLGYKNYWQCLNAKNYGIPQNRDRCFMVSLLGDYYYEFPKPTSFEKLYIENYITTSKLNKRKNKPTKRMLSALIGSGIIVDVYNKRLINIFPTIKASISKNNDIWYLSKKKWYKPTAKDCYRLMGFDDGDFEKASKVNSNSQLYKQAGNSIVVNVLEQIFKNITEVEK